MKMAYFVITAFICTFLTACILAEPLSESQAERKYKLSDCFKVDTNKEGEKVHLVSIERIDYFLNEISKHARDYPPKFSSIEQRNQIEHELKSVTLMLETISQNNPENQDILWRLGFAYSMGHNLDIPGSVDKCDKCFEKLLTLKPDHPRGNFLYGAFLAGTAARQKDSIIYLEKAVDMGFDDAIYMLGFVYIGLDDKEKALEYFQKYLNKHPDNKDAITMIDAIKSGKGQMIKKY